MTLTIRKIEHRGATRIGISFPYCPVTNAKLKQLGAVYSKTHRCWYMGYTRDAYRLLQENFDRIEIETTHTTYPATQPAAGSVSRAIPPIGDAMPSEGEAAEPKLPARAEEAPAMEHKAAPVRLAQTLRLQRYDVMGKWTWTRLENRLYPHAKANLPAKRYQTQGGMPRVRSPIDGFTSECPFLVNIKTIKKTTKLDI
jgi:hypothetical protein